MQLTYSRRVFMRSALFMLLFACVFVAMMIWPSHRFSGLFSQIVGALGAPLFLYAAFIFIRRARSGPAAVAAVDGLWVNTGRQRHYAWRDIASIGRTTRTVYMKKRIEVPVIEIVLREPGAKAIAVSIGTLNEGEAGADRWIEEANRRLAAAMPQAA